MATLYAFRHRGLNPSNYDIVGTAIGGECELDVQQSSKEDLNEDRLDSPARQIRGRFLGVVAGSGKRLRAVWKGLSVTS